MGGFSRKIKFNQLIVGILLFLFFSTCSYANFCDETGNVELKNYTKFLSIPTSVFEGEDVYAACKEMPNDNNKVILVFSPPSTSHTKLNIDSYDLIILVVDSSNAKILSKYIEPNAISSDIFSYSSIDIDTSNYLIGLQERAFGIRVSHRAGNNLSEESLGLYMPIGKEIKKLLSGLIVNSSRSDVNQTCDATYTDASSVIIVDITNKNGLSNLILKTTETISTVIPVGKKKYNPVDGCATKEIVKIQKTKLFFNGKNYNIPKAFRSLMYR